MKWHRFSDLVAGGYVKNRMTLKRWVDGGIFPPPHDLGPNTAGWSDQDLAERDERVKAGITERHPEWQARAAERKARRAARFGSRMT
jgi:hypothetical protein